MPEIWDVLDAQRRVTGRHWTRGEEPAGPDDYHLVVEIWTIQESTGYVLLTLRHPDKPHGNTWECTGGSALAGEDSLTAVRRELCEETGLTLGNTAPHLLHKFTKPHVHFDSYAAVLNFTNKDIRLQEGETVDRRLVPLEDIDPAQLAAPIALRFVEVREELRRMIQTIGCSK